MSTKFYEKRNDIDGKNLKEHADDALIDPLKCMSFFQGKNDITLSYFDSTLFHTRFDVLLWNYAKKMIDDGTISESEVTGKIMSKFGEPSITKR
ncbi:hypothetical protein H5410_003694 [Solanum commersonii]|uniref:Uncharacterized protein n=1 Tax=Solanum commersonii TaxID=4109 RepID=A0A9J6B5M2_SOLCO|nr:hypothetical protein H5410_003694 [Solanum commersonii]